MEAMPEGGVIQIDTVQRRQAAEITIQDSGPGITDEERERIFEPFFSTKDGGTGLGLAVSYGIIAAHGGNLELIPTAGRGACFRFTLPSGEAQ
jgi:signal transduction histidine kinase